MSALGDRVLFPYAFVFILLSLVCMLFVRHGDARPALSGSVLERLDVDN